MRRLKPTDRLLLGVLLPLWVVAFGLHVREVVHGRLGWVGGFVAGRGAGEPPVVRGFWPGSGADASGLAVGDPIVAMGDAPIAGVGPIGFLARALATARGGRVAVRYVHDGTARDGDVPIVAAAYPWRIAPLVVAMALTGALVLLRVPHAPIGRTFFLAAITYALQWTFFPGPSPVQTAAWAAVYLGASLVTFPFWVQAALLFPAETAPQGGRAPWWPWAFALFGPAALTWVLGTPLPPASGQSVALAVNVVFIATVLTILTRNYRRVGALGRRQLRWVLFGLYVALVPVLAVDAIGAAVPALWWLHEVVAVTLVLVPFAFLVAIVRTNLFDIDRVVTATAVYSILSFLVLAALLGVVPFVAPLLARLLTVDPSTAQVGLSVGLAAALSPGHRLLRPRIERIFFAERVALRDDVDELLRRLGTVDDPERLVRLIATELDRLLRPSRCLLYRLDGDAYVPTEIGAPPAHARPAPPLEAAWLAGAPAGPIDLQTDAAGVARPTLGASTQTLLAALGVAVLLPIRDGAQLPAFVGVGGMRSGDVYTSADMALLAAIASHAATELRRIALGRYLPAEVATLLATDPAALAPAEREITVLFCDMQGSTRIAEALPAETLRGFQDEYLRRLADVVAREGGLLVKTLGDAVMALWNAPVAVADHAARAARAALALPAAVDALNVAWAAAEVEVEPVTVRVGVNTGVASVGNFGGSARVEYDARGDTVNTAARLEALGKEYGTHILVSEATRARLGGDFVLRELDAVQVSGREQAIVVHELLGERAATGSPAAERLAARWAAMLACYRARAFDDALAHLDAIARDHPDDEPTRRFVARCRAFRTTPPPADWDGVHRAQAK